MPDVAPSTEGVWSELRVNIRGFVGRRVRQPADVDDIVQRVFLQGTVHLRRLATPTAFTKLASINASPARDLLKRRESNPPPGLWLSPGQAEG